MTLRKLFSPHQDPFSQNNKRELNYRILTSRNVHTKAKKGRCKIKVAILGAGFAGLACARHLEQNGIYPDIFEKRHRVGERFPNMEAIMHLMHRPIKDSLVYINDLLNVDLQPAAVVHTVEMHSPNHKTVINGHLGYSTIRGHDDRSWECQLARYIKSDIIFNTQPDYQELAQEYDWVVVATGDSIIPRDLGVWTTDIEPFLRGCIIKGDFDPGTIKLWFNQSLSKQGYVYFAPYDQDEACISVAAAPSSPEDIDTLWAKTVDYLGITPEPGSEFKVEEYKIGRVATRQVRNILLTGNAGGFIEPFMGFGQVPSLLSGFYAAKAIATGADYNRLTSWFNTRYQNSLVLRNYMNQLDNKAFDRLVLALSNKVSQNIINSSH
ncbi:MAG: NAD(P)-binding protein, partial [Syntrophomonadaceae bacterium]